MAIALFIYLLALACWLGGMVFFAILVAPVIFSRLPISEAGKVVSGIFPRYYMLGYVAGIISVILAIYFAFVWLPRLWWVVTTLVLITALALTLYSGVVIRPRVDAIRTVAEETNPDPARHTEFSRLHRLSVSLNGAVMVLDLIALLTTAAALVTHG